MFKDIWKRSKTIIPLELTSHRFLHRGDGFPYLPFGLQSFVVEDEQEAQIASLEPRFRH